MKGKYVKLKPDRVMPCDIRNLIEIINWVKMKKRHKPIKCGFKKWCERKDKGNYQECG